jgi:hypothetical protein
VEKLTRGAIRASGSANDSRENLIICLSALATTCDRWGQMA